MTLPKYGISVYKVVTADWFWAFIIVVGAFIVPAPESGAATVLGLPKLCLFRNVTGIACPGCGMTRSLIATGHFHIRDAVAFHPLGPPVLAALVVYVLSQITRFLGNRLSNDKCLTEHAKPVILVLIGTFAVVWVLRLTGYLPTPA